MKIYQIDRYTFRYAYFFDEFLLRGNTYIDWKKSTNQAIYKTRFICLYITEKMGEEKIAAGIEPAEVKK